LLPGLGIKRWLILAAIGIALILDAANRWVVAEGTGFHVNEFLDGAVNDYFSPSYLTWVFAIAGIAMIVIGVRQWLRALVKASISPSRGNGVLDALIGRRLEDGYKIVAIGGGTGLATLLRGLKRQTTNITAVVTVSDDGGSSGRLQKELGVLPPGDVRNCLVALADNEALVTDLFRYRFADGEGLSGHSFGNLFLAAMTGITGNFDRAIKESSRVLNIVGRVLPATLSVASLCAELDDGTIVRGESNIPHAGRPIRRVFFDPPRVEALDEVLTAIRDADAIVLGPGSLFTSILPNLLIERITAEIVASNAIRMYVCNVMTQPGETERMSASEHVSALFAHAGGRICDYVIVNDQPPSKLLEVYAEEHQAPVVDDVGRIEALGLTAVRAHVISETQTVRHDSEKLAQVVFGVIDRAIADRATFVRSARAYRNAATASATATASPPETTPDRG
ncbi:MAG TPA: YvcK family protein, partial [Candidatus Dormibacteraeota bacterium]|nr:YvcK family protein [Candidatus Dormibacteraeota bacterium]